MTSFCTSSSLSPVKRMGAVNLRRSLLIFASAEGRDRSGGATPGGSPSLTGTRMASPTRSSVSMKILTGSMGR
jgi:hypothetical protein